MADSDIETAVARALEDSPDRNFTETVDLAINLRDLDLNEPSNRVDESIVLPSGTGQETRIVVIAEGETAVRADEAKDMADETDFFIAEEAMMQDIARHLGTILGPRGKMPDPLAPDDDVVETVNRLKNTVQLRSGDRRTFHTLVGSEEMDAEDVADNIDVILRRLHADLEKGPQNIDAVYVKTTMGPSVEVA